MTAGRPSTVSHPDVAGGGAADSPGILVDAGWLAARATQPGLVILHCDGDGSSDRFATGHIPGARYANVSEELSDPASPYSYTLPAGEALAAAFGRLGIDDESTVAVYDADNGAWAARVFWNLRSIEFERVVVLDGGLGAWAETGAPIEKGNNPAPKPQAVTAGRASGTFAGRADIEAIVSGQRHVQLVTNGSPAQYIGTPIGNGLRPGHIPGSLNAPASELVGPTGRLLPATELRAAFERAGVDVDEPTVTYCGAGIAASLGALALTILGNDRVAVYDGSLQEWSADPALPLVTGSNPH